MKDKYFKNKIKEKALKILILFFILFGIVFFKNIVDEKIDATDKKWTEMEKQIEEAKMVQKKVSTIMTESSFNGRSYFQDEKQLEAFQIMLLKKLENRKIQIQGIRPIEENKEKARNEFEFEMNLFCKWEAAVGLFREIEEADFEGEKKVINFVFFKIEAQKDGFLKISTRYKLYIM